MDDHQEQDALLKRIEELEKEKHTMMTELSNLKKNMNSSGSPCPQTDQNYHDFLFQLKSNKCDYQSLPHSINGVEFVVHMHLTTLTTNERYAPPPSRLTRFILWLKIKNNDAASDKFVLFSTDLEWAEKSTSQAPDATPPSVLFSRHFVVRRDEERISENRTLDLNLNRCPQWKIKIRHTAIVQTLESTDVDAQNTAVVIVKNKEFRVSIDYLSMWSSYFRAYFRVDMKDKQEGRYPIGNEDIEPEEFQELMDVIHPTDRDICKGNYLLLLRLANWFEMPALTRRIELFMIDFDKNKIRLANAFRIASDVYSLKIVQTMLLLRWRDPQLMEEELLKSEEYDQLSAETKNLVHERFTQACISSKGTNSNRATDQDRRRAVSPTDDTCRRLMALGRNRHGAGGGFGESDRRGQDRGGFGRDRDEARGGFGYGAPPDNDGFGGYGGGFDDRD